MQPITLSRFWHRRICEAALLVSIGIVALYFLPYFGSFDITSSIIVTTPILILASVTAIVSFVSYLWIPRNTVTWAGLTVYLLLTITAAGLIYTTGGATSPFIALWMLVTVFAGIFGVFGLLPILIAISAFIASSYLAGELGPELLVVVAFAGVIPLIASFIIWHGRGSQSDEGDEGGKAYKNLASELSEVATKSEVVINAIGDGVIAVDAQGIIQLINPAAQQILGWGKQDAMALSYKSVLRLVDLKNAELDPAKDPIQQALNTNQEIRDNDLTIITHSDKKILGALVVSPIGEVGSGVIIVFRDITKEKAEEREQAEFISTASHEMRTPVASIEGYLGLALNPNTAQIDDKARDFILKAHEAAQHLGRLFQDLLDVSKADDGRMANIPKVVDVMSFTHDIVQGLTQKATDKGLRLTFKPNPDDGAKHVTPVYHVNLDNDHIREIIDNLTENAIKYTPAGEVVVDVTGTDDKVVISIKDSGIGIPAEDMPHLFQKFYRVDNAETNQIGGTGLGLYLCRRLAETMGGRIWAESEYKKGSTFYVELPRISTQDAAALAEEQAKQAADDAAAAASAPAQPETPTMPPVVSAAPADSTASTSALTGVQPATTVPRGESLSAEQKAAQVARLKAMVQEQAAAEQPVSTDAPATPSVDSRPASVAIPVRDPGQ